MKFALQIAVGLSLAVGGALLFRKIHRMPW